MNQLVETVVNSKLADTAPALVGTVVILAVVLVPIAWLAYRAVMVLDKWFERHEEAEKDQFAKVEKNTEATVDNSAAQREVAHAVHRLADQLVRRAPPDPQESGGVSLALAPE